MTVTTPTTEEVKNLQNTIRQMDKKTFDLYKQLAEVLVKNMPVFSDDSSYATAIEKQKRFIQETAGKIEIDEEAVNDLRERSMI